LHAFCDFSMAYCVRILCSIKRTISLFWIKGSSLSSHYVPNDNSAERRPIPTCRPPPFPKPTHRPAHQPLIKT
jgi:hypothetical protein